MGALLEAGRRRGSASTLAVKVPRATRPGCSRPCPRHTSRRPQWGMERRWGGGGEPQGGPRWASNRAPSTFVDNARQATGGLGWPVLFYFCQRNSLGWAPRFPSWDPKREVFERGGSSRVACAENTVMLLAVMMSGTQHRVLYPHDGLADSRSQRPLEGSYEVNLLFGSDSYGRRAEPSFAGQTARASTRPVCRRGRGINRQGIPAGTSQGKPMLVLTSTAASACSCPVCVCTRCTCE